MGRAETQSPGMTAQVLPADFQTLEKQARDKRERLKRGLQSSIVEALSTGCELGVNCSLERQGTSSVAAEEALGSAYGHRSVRTERGWPTSQNRRFLY